MLIGEKIKTTRKKLGYTQEELAKKLSVSRSTIANWENGKSTPNENKLKEISGLFNISLEDLTNEDGSSEETTETTETNTIETNKVEIPKDIESTDTTQSNNTTKSTPNKKAFSKYKRTKAKPFNLFCVMSGFILLFGILILDTIFGNLSDYLSVIIFDQKFHLTNSDDTLIIPIAAMAVITLIVFLIAIIKAYRKTKKAEKPDGYVVASNNAAIKKRRQKNLLKFLVGFLTPTILAIVATCFIVSNAYEKAIKEHENLNYEKGNAIFLTLYNYKDSKDRIIDLTEQMVLSNDFIATIDRETQKVKIEWKNKKPNYKFDVSKWENVVNIDYGEDYNFDKGYISYFVGVTEDGKVLFSGNNKAIKSAVKEWEDIVQVSAQDDFLIGLKKDGTVVAAGNNDSGQCNVSGWEDIVKIETNSYNTFGTKKNGEIVCTNDNSYLLEDKQLVGTRSYSLFTCYYDVKNVSGNEIEIKTDGSYNIYSNDYFFLPEIPDCWDINKKLIAIESSNDGSLVCLMFSDGSTSIHERYKESIYSGSSSYGGSSSSDVEYGAGGYEMPNENDDSVADYIQRVDPDLYDDMKDRYDDAVNDYNNSDSNGFVGSDGEYHSYIPEYGDDVNNWMAENW